jgi:hypothetical protein
MTPLAPATDVRNRLLARLRGPERFALFGTELATAFGVTREAALEALRLIDDASVWRPGDVPGSRMFATQALREQGALVVHLPANTQLGKHTHTQRELTMVLDGLLIENATVEHRAGAVLDLPSGSEHSVAVPAAHHCLVVFTRR